MYSTHTHPMPIIIWHIPTHVWSELQSLHIHIHITFIPYRLAINTAPAAGWESLFYRFVYSVWKWICTIYLSMRCDVCCTYIVYSVVYGIRVRVELNSIRYNIICVLYIYIYIYEQHKAMYIYNMYVHII